jgi:phosphatidylserine decarboxylase
VDAEVPLGVYPYTLRIPARGARNIAELLDGILVRVFGVDAFAGFETEAAFADVHTVIACADEMHFDPAVLRIVDCFVAEIIWIEVGPEFAIDAMKQIEIERCGDAGRIVVSVDQNPWVLFQIDANDETSTLADHFAKDGE